MKQHIKKIHFLVIALFTIMLSSCSDDLYHQGSKPAAKNETVSIEEFKRNTGLHNFGKTFKIPKNDNSISYRNADGSYELSDFDINFDYIKQVVVENKISYTFNIQPKIVTSKSIFNLVVYNNEGNWETSIIELIPSEDNFSKLLSGITDKFKGSIRQVYASRVQQDCNIIAYNVVRCIDPNSVKCRIECDKCADCLKLIFFAVCNGNDIVQPLYVLPGSSGGASIGSGSGLSDPSGYIFDPNMYELGSKKYQQAKNAAEFWHGLSVSQQRWVYGNENENNFETYRDIIAYINRPENIDNTEAKNFGREIIEQMILNPELKLDINASAKSPAFVDMSSIDGSTPEGAKFNKVYDALKASPLFRSLFTDMFNQTPFINVKFKIEDIPQTSLNEHKNGTCKLYYNTDYSNLYNIVTIDRNHLLHKSNLDIALTIIHEYIHAYLNVKFRIPSVGQPIPFSEINNKDLKDCINTYYNGFSGNQTQHSFFSDFMVPTIREILSNVKDILVSSQQANGVQNPTNGGAFLYYPLTNPPQLGQISDTYATWNWNTFFNYFAFNGLQNCTSYPYSKPTNQNHIFNNEEDFFRYYYISVYNTIFNQ